MPRARDDILRATAVAVVLVVLAAAAPAAARGAEPVTFRGAGGVELQGSVLVGTGPAPRPGVVMLHGSGPATREAYVAQARALAERGVTALVFDKRGSGRSGGSGDYRYRELAGDAVAAVAALRARPDVRPDGVAVWGLSEGGSIAALAAQAGPAVSAVVALSPSAIEPVRQQEWAVRHAMIDDGARPWTTRSVTTLYAALAALGRDGVGPRLLRDLGFRPAAAWRDVRAPVLAFFGGEDDLVPVGESAAALERALAGRPGDVRRIEVLPGAPHNLATVRDGELTWPARLHDLTAAWIRDAAGGRPSPAGGAGTPGAARTSSPVGVLGPAWAGSAPRWPLWAALALGSAVAAVVGLATTRLRRLGAAALLADVLAVLALAGGLAATVGADGQGVLMVAGIPIGVLVCLVAGLAGAVLSVRLLLHPRGDRGARALAAGSALWLALLAVVVV